MRPSTAVIEALLHLGSSLQDLWTTVDPVRKKKLVSESVAHLVSRSCAFDSTEHTDPAQALQYYWDVRLIQQLLRAWELPKAQAQLDARIPELREKVRGPCETVQLYHHLTTV